MASLQSTQINPPRLHRNQIKFLVILIPMSIFMLLPIVYVFSTAFKPLEELFAFPPTFFVRRPTLSNFQYLFSDIKIYRYLFNSLTVTIAIMIISILSSSLAAYALSKKNFAMKKILFEINTLALMFVGTAVVIPRFMVISNIGIIDTFWGHILPMVAMPVGLFLVKQFIDQIPDALVESAQVSGANDLTIFFQIIVPMIKPALATIAILSFQMAWNSDESSKYFVSQESMRTFAYYITSLTGADNVIVGLGMSSAGVLVMFIPNFIIFIFMQRKVMDTMAHSGIK